MAKVFISFLGTSKYIHCKYEIDGKASEPVRYVQEALATHYCKNWTKEDSFVVLATRDSRQKEKSLEGSIKKNWEGGEVDSEDIKAKSLEENPRCGLKDRLNALHLDCQVMMEEISDGGQPNEIWEIIKVASEVIKEGDELYFDITHSFRYIPMIVPAIISFLEKIKNVKVAQIHYGAFEALGPRKNILGLELEKRIAPVKNLVELYEMIGWSEATQAFIDYGDEKKLISQIGKQKPKKFKDQEEKTFWDSLGRIGDEIKTLGEALRLTNVKKLKKTELSACFDAIEKSENHQFYPLIKLMTKIKHMLSQWSDDRIENGFLAAQWCVDHDRLAQALTFAHEALKGFYCLLFGWDNKRDYREMIGFLHSVQKDPNKKLSSYADDTAENIQWLLQNGECAVKKLGTTLDLNEKFVKISNWRNKVNHAEDGKRQAINDEFPNALTFIQSQYREYTSAGKII